LMALEGFLGVLIGSICSAIFFAKVSRIQSFAQVDFSEVVCIRYGDGQSDESVMKKEKVDKRTAQQNHIDDESSSAYHDELNVKLPCPILEFRLVNRMHNIPGGEIVDARISVVASIDASNVDSYSPKKGIGRGPVTASMKRRAGKKRRGSQRTPTPTTTNYGLSERLLSMRRLATPPLDDNNDDNLGQTRGTTGIPRTVLAKLECENLDHPFFKRVFTIRHKLDEFSPLLKVRPKLLIRQNDGYWPQELNDPKSVRESMYFDEIIVRMTGLSNADANTVFSHTVYDPTDLRVGYQFQNMLYRSPRDGSLKADKSLLSSIVEQDGGGGEDVSSECNVRKVRDVSMRL
jgi:hypothetical protein